MNNQRATKLESADPGCLLLVDDDDALRRVLAKRMRREGHEVIEASNGAEALRILEGRSFDVVVCDIRMPDMDGMELLRLVREREPDVPFVLLTGAPDVATAVKAVGYGAFEYLTKPTDLPGLGASVARAVTAHRAATTRRRKLESVEERSALDSGVRRAASAIAEGTLLAGRYRVGHSIGAGGMGTVYEGQREDLAGMPVAIKVLHPRFEDRTEVLVRFRREAEVVATLDHPNIVRVLDFVASPEGPAFLVMELLRGQTLASAIALEAPFPEQRVAFIASQVLAALEAAHAANVVHRDLKPENLLLTTISGIADVVKLLDFGIAKLLVAAEDDRLTKTGHVLGTPAYMAPEYARGEAASVAGDVYALGCVMYQALTGEQPFTGTNYNAVLFAIQQRSPRPIREVRPDLSEEIVKVVERAMARDAADRFPSARAMAEALRPWAPESVRASVGTPLCIAPTVEAVVSSGAVVSDRPSDSSG